MDSESSLLLATTRLSAAVNVIGTEMTPWPFKLLSGLQTRSYFRHSLLINIGGHRFSPWLQCLRMQERLDWMLRAHMCQQLARLLRRWISALVM